MIWLGTPLAIFSHHFSCEFFSCLINFKKKVFILCACMCLSVGVCSHARSAHPWQRASGPLELELHTAVAVREPSPDSFSAQPAILGSLLAMADLEERKRAGLALDPTVHPSPLPHFCPISAPACKRVVGTDSSYLSCCCSKGFYCCAGREGLISAPNSRVTLH